MDAEWLKAQFETQPHKSKSILARLLGLDSPAISKILSGARQIKAREYSIMRSYFGLPVYDQDDLRPAALKSSGAPQTMVAVGERPVKKTGLQDWLLPETLVPARKNIPKNVTIFVVPDDLMAPEFRKGESVLIDRDDRKIEKSGVFLISDGFGTMIRNCSPAPGQGGRIRVVASSPDFQPTLLETGDFEILGRVAGKVFWV